MSKTSGYAAKAVNESLKPFTRTSPEKGAQALELGADEVVISKDSEAMKARENSLDFILNTVAFVHDLNSYLALLKHDATMCLVGLPSKAFESLEANPLIVKRRSLAGSLIGGIKETQELLDFCAEHHIGAMIELIKMEQVNEAFERMLKGDVKFRFVIDVASWVGS